MLEIEQKFRVASHDPVRSALQKLEAARVAVKTEHDTYLAHPSRDFATTDEAFRLRTSETNGLPAHVITYKGPRTGKRVKSRREIEVPIGDQGFQRGEIIELYVALGFRPVADVQKQREFWRFNPASLSQSGITNRSSGEPEMNVTVCLDQVAGLSPHVEVEVVTHDKSTAQHLVQRVSDALNLRELEQRSYLELVIESQSTNT